MPTSRPHEAFVRLFAQHERGVFAYILSLLADWTAAEEVFQETCVVLWDKFDDFEEGTNFGAWARKIAHFKVLKYREQRAKQLPLLSDEFLQQVAAADESQSEALLDRLRVLPACVEKLSPSDRELLTERYAGNDTARDVAKRVGRPENTVYKALSRIRGQLLECIRTTLAQEAQVS